METTPKPYPKGPHKCTKLTAAQVGEYAIALARRHPGWRGQVEVKESEPTTRYWKAHDQ